MRPPLCARTSATASSALTDGVAWASSSGLATALALASNAGTAARTPIRTVNMTASGRGIFTTAPHHVPRDAIGDSAVPGYSARLMSTLTRTRSPGS